MLSLLVTDDREIAELNERFRSKAKPTDVLSFPSGAQSLPMNELGDVVISIDTARRQAAERDLPLKHEITRLLIHGTLHLLGYDHEGVSPAVARKMRREEDRLYDELSLTGGMRKERNL